MFLLRTFSMAFAMFWEILWTLILGFALSGVQSGRFQHLRILSRRTRLTGRE